MNSRLATGFRLLVALAAIVLSSPAAFAEDYHDPDPAWLRAALKEPFKHEQLSGQANGYDVSLDRAQIQPYRDGA